MHAADAGDQAVLEEALQQVGQRRRLDHGRRARRSLPRSASISGRAQANTAWNMTNRMASRMTQPGHGMQQHGIDPRRAARRARPDCAPPRAAARSASRWPTRSSPASGARQSAAPAAGRSSSTPVDLGQQRVGAAAAHRDRLHDRHAELARQALDVDLDAALARDVHHVERQHHRPADALQLEREAQRQPQVGGVGDADDQVGRRPRSAGGPARRRA